MTKLIYGVGVNDGKYLAKVKGKHLMEYHLWRRFLERCYSSKTQEKHPSYIGCQSSDNFKRYSYFYEWCQNQIGFGQKDFELDKDLIFKGNKVYSEDTCLFLPRSLNLLLTARKNLRGSLPIGVSAHKSGFQAQCCTDKTSPRSLGYFPTPEIAFQAYKQAKEAYIKRQAEKWKDFIDPRAYTALMTYEVQITD